MAKRNLNISENFLTSNVFTFDSYACVPAVERTYPFPGEAIETLKVYADKQSPIKFAFGSKVGLVRINTDGSVAESNILGKLTAIPGGRIENYFDFFKRNGFLFPLSATEYNPVDSIALQSIIDRLHATLELMSTITDMSRTSYENISRLIFYHLFAPVVEIETNGEKYSYRQALHPYTKNHEAACFLPHEDRLNDTFNNATFDFKDTVSGITLDSDFVSKMLNDTPPEDKYDNDHFKKIFAMYCAPKDAVSKRDRIINDFLFHYCYEIGMVEQADLASIIFFNGEVDKTNFSEEMKKAAMLTAKIIIKEEIELNLNRLKATYDIQKMEPAWRIDSLLSALYFGLFYMRPNSEIYRRCANPKCGEFFLVSVSSQKKKYCCKACMNRAMAARKRARTKIEESKKA